jgi:sulfate/thiosulfate transport system substrate-binding protein
MNPRKLTLIAIVPALLALAAAGCGGTSDSSGGSGGNVALVAYSTPKEAYAEVIPAFKKSPAGKDVGFSQSYGASGDQTRAVESGLPADVVALSLALDTDKLVKKGLVAEDWDKGKYGGFVTNSVVVFAVRKGNPKNIKTWDDLTKPGVQVLEPNPFTSGGAKWNVMAAYGAQIEQGKTPAQALDYLKALFKNVVVQDKSAREALQTFSAGKGDVLLAYENEAIAGQQAGQELDYVVPDQTILIQNPIAVTKDAKNAKTAKAFVDFTTTSEAQKIFVSKGYRPVVASANDPSKFPDPPGLFKIDKFGGWSKVNDEFFDPDKGKVAEIEKDLGVSTSK